MTEYEFTLKFRLPGAGADPEQLIAALAEAGCDDALIGIGLPGRIALDFTREAASAFDAVASAIRNVREAIPSAELIEAVPDLVSLSDVAELAGCTRQNIRKLMLSHIATFPAPVHEGSPSVWHLANVLAWLALQPQREVDPALMEVAEATMRLNIAKEARRLTGMSLPRELAPLFA